MTEDALQPPQTQPVQPGLEGEMDPQPRSFTRDWIGSGKLAGRTALVTGGDSGIGRAVAIGFAKEGADVVIAYRDEEEDAQATCAHVEREGRRCLAIGGDIADRDFCNDLVGSAARFLGDRIDILVNNAAVQHPVEDFADIEDELIERTFRVNILSMFWITRPALAHMPKGSSIINSTSVTAYRGSAQLVDYAATKGAIVAFTRSLSQSLWPERRIRVNAVAPGPIWTPLIPASFDAERVARHGSSVPMNRAGQPDEVAPSYIFLASDRDASYVTGQVLHPNGGSVVNG
ncbi:SDR family oxidoreductase [Elioraea rosea]|uniref:SDR family oxidoreductase n=1 Tax=Elioraea rosea TaxID=2492390 RepID=UPI0011838951|nr:SDR family oxidoreductase [Elioraea rosea]